MSNQTSTIQQIRQHSRQLVRELDIVKGVYLGSGYTFQQCHIMFELSIHNGLNLLDLAEKLLLDKSNTSRTVKKLVEQGLVRSASVASDQRQKLFSLTAKGRKVLQGTTDLADKQVSQALQHLDPQQQQVVIEGLRLYSNALAKGRIQAGYQIRQIQKPDNAPTAKLLRQVLTEFQAVGEGYSIVDPEIDNMHGSYRGKRHAYYVITHQDKNLQQEKVVGCGGIAPLQGGDAGTCELRKMFFLPRARGFGLGRRLLAVLLDEAKKRGYTQCYIETLHRMAQAKSLYEKNGFVPLKKSLGTTGHNQCDCWYLKEL